MTGNNVRGGVFRPGQGRAAGELISPGASAAPVKGYMPEHFCAFLVIHWDSEVVFWLHVCGTCVPIGSAQSGGKSADSGHCAISLIA